MDEKVCIENGELVNENTKKREIKPVLIPNVVFFILTPIFLIFIPVFISIIIEKHGFISVPITFMIFVVFTAGVIGASYVIKYFFKTGFDISDAPVLPKNWSRYYPNKWEAIKSNSFVVMFVMFFILLLTGAIIEKPLTFIYYMTGAFICFAVPSLTIYLLMKWRKLNHIDIYGMKLDAVSFPFMWLFFMIILMKILQVLLKNKIMFDPGRTYFGIAILAAAYIVLVVLALIQKNE